jgi:hypothetical protein
VSGLPRCARSAIAFLPIRKLSSHRSRRVIVVARLVDGVARGME